MSTSAYGLATSESLDSKLRHHTLLCRLTVLYRIGRERGLPSNLLTCLSLPQLSLCGLLDFRHRKVSTHAQPSLQQHVARVWRCLRRGHACQGKPASSLSALMQGSGKSCVDRCGVVSGGYLYFFWVGAMKQLCKS